MVTFDDILRASARLSGIAHETPVLTSRTFNELTGNEVFFKAENFQRVGAFKFRGAFNKLASLSDAQKRGGVIAHSSGNHAQGVALASKLLGIRAVIVMPHNSVKNKIDATKSYGAEVVYCGDSTDERERVCSELMVSSGYTLIHPYNDPVLIAGQGTAALELFRHTGPLDYLYVPVGGGGLLAGSAIAAKQASPGVKIIGVETEGADDANQTFRQRSIVKLKTVQTIADGMRTLSIGSLNFEIMMQYVDDMTTISDGDIYPMMRFFHERMKIVVEPTGAVAPAAVFKNSLQLRGKRIGVLISGGNVDPSVFRNVLNS
jgi:threonine ammonia-lyase medium form